MLIFSVAASAQSIPNSTRCIKFKHGTTRTEGIKQFVSYLESEGFEIDYVNDRQSKIVTKRTYSGVQNDEYVINAIVTNDDITVYPTIWCSDITLRGQADYSMDAPKAGNMFIKHTYRKMAERVVHFGKPEFSKDKPIWCVLTLPLPPLVLM